MDVQLFIYIFAALVRRWPPTIKNVVFIIHKWFFFVLPSLSISDWILYRSYKLILRLIQLSCALSTLDLRLLMSWIYSESRSDIWCWECSEKRFFIVIISKLVQVIAASCFLLFLNFGRNKFGLSISLDSLIFRNTLLFAALEHFFCVGLRMIGGHTRRLGS